MPLSFSTPPDPIKFLGVKSAHPAPISEFLKIISDTTEELEREGIDTARFLTVFEINLQSTKKITSADIVAGINNSPGSGVLLVSKKVDPNKSHPLTQKKLIAKVGNKVNGMEFNSRTIQALLWNHKLRDNDRYCWKNDNTNTYQYSHDLVAWCKKLTSKDIQEARAAYTQHMRERPASIGTK